MKLHEIANHVALCPKCKAELSLTKLEWGSVYALSELKPTSKVQCWECLKESPARSFTLKEVKS